MHKMNAKKSADYCKLIENVKNKYRKNPIYAKNTPHIKYMLIGQDFGPPEKEEIKGTIANVRKMNDGIDVMFHENVDLEARDSQTDKILSDTLNCLVKKKLMSINIQICFSAIVIWAIAEISILEI